MNLSVTLAGAVTANYQYRLAGQLKIQFYAAPSMDGWPAGEQAMDG
jgi:hypothetical protein